MKSIITVGSLLICVLLLTACGGLAGEPEVVGQVPQQAPQAVTVLQPPNTQPDLTRGAEIFAENCVRCHGATGVGDGEFVQSGQITAIPDFTDPAQHAERTPAEYYTQVTNGNLAKLMPPFSGSLSDEERWSVANYVFTLAGGTVPVITTNPEAISSADAESDTPESLSDTEMQRDGFVNSRQWLSYGIIATGIVFLAIAVLLYWRASQTIPAVGPENYVQVLMKQIAALDNQYQSGAIKQRDYEKQRQSLKDKVTKLMK
jgi:mono/diheme cytochrome c family protein